MRTYCLTGLIFNFIAGLCSIIIVPWTTEDSEDSDAFILYRNDENAALVHKLYASNYSTDLLDALDV